MTLAAGRVPTTEELEFLKQNRERVGQIIRARWVLLALLSLYGLVVHVLFQHKSADVESLRLVHLVVPFAAVLVVGTYNACFQCIYRRFARIRALNQMQLLFDLVVVTVLVHFSGGTVSWFWAMYLVLTLEAALIMDRKSDTYAIALAGTIALGGLYTFEFYGIVSPVAMPFENNALQHNYSYAIIKWAWISIVDFGVAFVAAFLMDAVRRREALLRELVIRDELTGLYSRRYFFYRLNSEIQRARRYGRTLSLLLLDVDDFKSFNDAHGHLEGDALLRIIAKVLRTNIRRSDDKPSYEVDIACRYGGEEFTVILPETASRQGTIAADRIRVAVETAGTAWEAGQGRRDVAAGGGEAGVTVSVGVASYPEHGGDAEQVIRAADRAMYAAKQTGKNRVTRAEVAAVAPPGGAQDG